jgi:hypothetical protein
VNVGACVAQPGIQKLKQINSPATVYKILKFIKFLIFFIISPRYHPTALRVKLNRHLNIAGINNSAFFFNKFHKNASTWNNEHTLCKKLMVKKI